MSDMGVEILDEKLVSKAFTIPDCNPHTHKAKLSKSDQYYLVNGGLSDEDIFWFLRWTKQQFPDFDKVEIILHQTKH